MSKQRLRGYAVAFVAAVFLAGCEKSEDESPAGQTAKYVQEIKDGETQWNADIKARDVEKVVGHYASDATLLLPGETPTHGTDQLRYEWKQALGDPNYALTFTPQRVAVSAAGDLAYSQGTFSLSATDQATHKPTSATGSYVTVYRKSANGGWRALEDIATPTATAPAAGAGAAGVAPSGDVDADKEAAAVRAADTAWAAAWKARDTAKIAAAYAPDGVAMQPGAPAMAGAAAINAGLAEALKDPAFALEFKPDAAVVAKSGDLAYTRGSFTVTQTDPKTHKPAQVKGAYVTVWGRQADGSWKAVQDIASPGPPTVAAAPAT